MILRWTGKSLEVVDTRWLTGNQEVNPYSAVPWVRRCVDLRAGAVEAMPFVVLRGGEEVWPFPTFYPQTISALLGLTERALCLHGSAYWLKVQNRRGGLLGLRWLAPQTIRLVTDPACGLTGFQRVVGAEVVNLTPDDVVYFWEDAWDTEVGPGQPVAAAALRPARLVLSVLQYAAQYFESGAIPPFIISADVLPQERERLESWWNSIRGRVRSFWRAVVLQSEAKVQQLSVPSGKDLALPELLEETRKQIAVAFGVPQTLLEDAANYATAKEHRRSFYAETVIPRCQMLQQVLNEQLFGPLGLEFRFQPEKLEIFQQEEAEKAQALVALVQSGIITPDEAREQLGLPVPDRITTPVAETLGEVRGLTPEALADLHRWRRKCKERGRLADFTSNFIPEPLVEVVKSIGVERGWEAAFGWLSHYRTHALKKEPDRVYEDQLRRRVQSVLSSHLESIITAENVASAFQEELFATEMRAAIQPMLADVVVNEVLAQMALVGLYTDVAQVNTAALQWATMYSYDLIKGLTDTTREVVRHAVVEFLTTPGLTVSDLRRMLEPAFGPVRAEMIAITEVTRAYAQATAIYQQLLKDFGLEMVRVWRTSHDERVCPVCAPNENKPEWDWTHPDGPPAHPRCRCWTVLEYNRRKR